MAVPYASVNPAHHLNQIFRKGGLEVTRYRPASQRRQKLIEDHEVASIIDGGANVGQYATEIRRAGFRGPILSFEPLNDVYEQLTSAARSDPLWSTMQCALSDRSRTAVIGVAANTASSSLLPMAKLHQDVAPHALITSEQPTDLRRLDEIREAHDLAEPTLLKLDVQGHEVAALDGAAGLIDRITVLECETSIRPLYTGQPLLRDLIDAAEGLGFHLWALEPAFPDPRDGTMLAYDAIFTREPANPEELQP